MDNSKYRPRHIAERNQAFNKAMEGTTFDYKIQDIGGEDCITRDGAVYRTIPRGNAINFLWKFTLDYGSKDRSREFLKGVNKGEESNEQAKT